MCVAHFGLRDVKRFLGQLKKFHHGRVEKRRQIFRGKLCAYYVTFNEI